MPEIIKLSDQEAVAMEAAKRWAAAAGEAVAERGAFTVMLSGGSTPRSLYELLAQEPIVSDEQWQNSYVFWGDERRVPLTHPDSNYRMASETLLSHVPVPAENLFPMDGTGLGKSAARDYENHMWRYFRFGSREWPVFDLVLLGIGRDGHIASIFPGTRAASDLSNKVIVYEVPALKQERMTITLPVINHARNIIVMAVGEEKAGVLDAVLNGPFLPSTYPAQAIKPLNGKLVYIVDEAAGARV